MRHIFLAILSIIIQTDLRQDNQVEVTYVHIQYRLNLESNEKLEVNKTKQVGDSIRRFKDSMSVKEIERFVSFTANVTMRAGEKSSYMFFSMNETSPSTINMKTPDTLFYENTSWKSVSDGKVSIKKSIELLLTITDQHKTLLGYDCTKFLAKNPANSREYEIWGTTSLPKTLLPFTGLKEFPVGILEINETSGLWSIKATSIRHIK
jgi:GLPGLI family protein